MTIHIGGKTDFSLGESILSPKTLVEQIAAKGYKSIAVADTNSISAMTKLFAAAKGVDLKVIIGATFNVVDDIAWRRAKRGEPKVAPNPFFYLPIYARNEDGLKAIMKLLTVANDTDHFYFKPQVSLDDVLAMLSANEGNVVVTTGNAFSVFAHREYASILNRIVSAVPYAGFAVEIPCVDSPYYNRVAKLAADYWLENPLLSPVISRPTLHLEEQESVRTTMNCILDREQVDSLWRREPANSSVKPYKNLVKEFGNFLNRNYAHDHTAKMRLATEVSTVMKQWADLFDYTFEKMPISLPEITKDPFKQLVAKSIAGWKRRIDQEVLGYKPDASKLPEYKARLKYELDTLRAMGFERYFLLVEGLTTWCKENDIMVGPGRGSVGGSLVAFLLGITDVDPIRFGLIFERFINPERLDLPDADLDFMSSRRDEALKYLIDTYGEANVAQISNYTELQGASTIRQVGSAHGLSEDDIRCSKLVPKEHGIPVSLTEAFEQVPEIEQFAMDHPDIWKECVALEGTFRSYGKHAAGVVVAGVPVADRAVLENRQNTRVINWDKRVVEDFGLVKLDVLGLQTLDLLALAKRYIEDRHPTKIVYDQIPLDDPQVLKEFGAGNTVGVFQFESGGMRHLLKSLASASPLTFEEIATVTALYRPGPMESGLMERYVAIRQGSEYPSYPHPSMEPALQETHSVIVFQEQVMQIARDLAGFTMAEADGLRKAMGKKDKDLMASSRTKWVDGCKSHSGMDEITAGMLFDQVEEFAGYGFNKSHSIEYSVISYWCMYLKVYYPAEFYAAALSVLGEDKLSGIVKDAATKGITVEPPEINISSTRYGIQGSRLYAPFQSIKGVSEKGAQAILKAREKTGGFNSKQEFLDAVDKRVCNVRVQAALDAIGAFALIEEDPIARDDPRRLKDQKILLPGIVLSNLKADRVIKLGPSIKKSLVEIIATSQGCTACSLSGTCHPTPALGKKPKFMIVADCPNWSEEKSGKMGKGDACESLTAAIDAAGLSAADYYLTSLIRANKGSGGTITNEMINGCSPYLQQEIELLNPPVIVTLGSVSVRHLLPDVKGGWEELAGQVHYLPKENRTIVIGFNPLMVHFDSSKQLILNKVFAEVADLVS